MGRILILICTFYLLTFQTLLASDHRWYPGDIARVVSMCETDNVLRTMALLMAENTEEDDALADEVWLKAILEGECVMNKNYVYVVQLTEKLEVFENLYGDNQDGELWQARVLLPTGQIVVVYVGMLETKAGKGVIQQSVSPSIET